MPAKKLFNCEGVQLITSGNLLNKKGLLGEDLLAEACCAKVVTAERVSSTIRVVVARFFMVLIFGYLLQLSNKFNNLTMINADV